MKHGVGTSPKSLLNVFGCIAFAHVPDKKRKRLDDRGENCIFVGYDMKSKAYRLYNPLNKNVISRDVDFDKENYWWTKQETLEACSSKMMMMSYRKYKRQTTKVFNLVQVHPHQMQVQVKTAPQEEPQEKHDAL